MKLYFIRHGETDWNAEGRLQGHSPSQLSEKGRIEARNLSLRLPQRFVHWPVYASDLKRTIETAHLLHDGCCPNLIPSPLLREISLGRWEGKLRSEVQNTEADLFNTFKQNASQFSISDGESFQEVQRRGLKFIRQILSTENAREILVVSHRGLIKSVLSYYQNRSLDEIWSEPNIPNCSLSTLDMSAVKVRILEYGQVL